MPHRNEAFEDLSLPLPRRLPLNKNDLKRIETIKRDQIEKYAWRPQVPKITYRVAHPLFVDEKIGFCKKLDAGIRSSRLERISAESGKKIKQYLQSMSVSFVDHNQGRRGKSRGTQAATLKSTESIPLPSDSDSDSDEVPSRPSSQASSFRCKIPKFERFPREYRDKKGRPRFRGSLTKELEFELFLPFPVRQEEPWWFDPKDGVDEGDDGSGILMDVQSETGARISVPLDGGPILIRSKQTVRSLHACCLIMNAAMEHHAVQVVPCSVTVALLVDGASHIAPPPQEAGVQDQWPQQGFRVHGNFFATGDHTSPVLFAPASATSDTSPFELDYRAYRCELPENKFPAQEIRNVERRLRTKLHAESDRALLASMWRIAEGAMGTGGVILAGKSGDVEELYKALGSFIKGREQSVPVHARVQLPDLPYHDEGVSTAAPLARIKPRTRTLPSFLYKPNKTAAQIEAEKQKRRDDAKARQANLVLTRDIVSKEREMDAQYRRAQEAVERAKQEGLEAQAAQARAAIEKEEACVAEREANAAEKEIDWIKQLGDNAKLAEAKKKAAILRQKATKEQLEADQATEAAKQEQVEADEALMLSEIELVKVEKIRREHEAMREMRTKTA